MVKKIQEIMFDEELVLAIKESRCISYMWESHVLDSLVKCDRKATIIFQDKFPLCKQCALNRISSLRDSAKYYSNQSKQSTDLALEIEKLVKG